MTDTLFKPFGFDAISRSSICRIFLDFTPQPVTRNARLGSRAINRH